MSKLTEKPMNTPDNKQNSKQEQGEQNSTLNRYQNPEIFEQLAIEYAVGSLHGRARKRFEVLMDTHFYLRAVVDAYENKFAHLVELLPDSQPSDRVWNNIENHIQEQNKSLKHTPDKAWWKSALFKRSFGLAAMALVITAVLFLNPMTLTPTVYSAVLETESHVPVAVTRISKSDMKLSIDIMKKVDIPEDMELSLWCHPKEGGEPMKMGEISKQGKTMISISQEEWKNLKNVGLLAIHIEPRNSHMDKPSNKIILKGKLTPSSDS